MNYRIYNIIFIHVYVNIQFLQHANIVSAHSTNQAQPAYCFLRLGKLTLTTNVYNQNCHLSGYIKPPGTQSTLP